MRRHLVGVGFVLVALVGCSGGGDYSGPVTGADPAQGAGTGPGPELGTIALVSERGIHLMRPDGTGLTRVVNFEEVRGLSLHPQRGRLAFGCGGLFPGDDELDAGKLCVVNADGSRRTLVADFSGLNDGAVVSVLFSPDGNQIAVQCRDVRPARITWWQRRTARQGRWRSGPPR
jgi:hypothetical protein